MGFIDKVKNFFYDEEEIEEEVPVKHEIAKKKPIVSNNKTEKKEIPERELFKAERTFNFPMDIDDDEPDFTPVEKNSKDDKSIESKKISRSSDTTTKTSYRSYSPVKPKEKEEKKFKPTPIISPIYGVIEGKLDNEKDKKNVTLGETKEFSITKRIDFDTVREKAYGKVKNDYIEDENEENEKKDIFFNLPDDEKELVSDDIHSDDFSNTDDIKITYNDVDYEDENEDEIEVPKITRLKKNKTVEIPKHKAEDDDILSETKEQDLFNLIDNMYNSEEEDDE